MKVKIITPKGYRRLRPRETIKSGDRYLWNEDLEWCLTECPGTVPLLQEMIYIRKLEKKGKKK